MSVRSRNNKDKDNKTDDTVSLSASSNISFTPAQTKKIVKPKPTSQSTQLPHENIFIKPIQSKSKPSKLSNPSKQSSTISTPSDIKTQTKQSSNSSDKQITPIALQSELPTNRHTKTNTDVSETNTIMTELNVSETNRSVKPQKNTKATKTPQPPTIIPFNKKQTDLDELAELVKPTKKLKPVGTEQTKETKEVDKFIADTIQKETDKKTVPDKINQDILKWVAIDNKIREMTNLINELKKERKPFEQPILDYLEKANEQSINIVGGRLYRSEAETKASMTLDFIKASIKTKVTNQEDFDYIVDQLVNNRPVKTYVNLTRRNNANNKNVKI